MNPTTRRFPRTLRDAFPAEARHAYAIERYPREARMLADIGACALVAVLLAAGLVWWWGAP